MKTLYDMIAEAIEAKANAEKFLNDGLTNKMLMRLSDGTIRPRYCQYCVEEFGRKVVPRMQSWEFNLSDMELEIIRKAAEQEWDYFWNDVSNKLKQDGYDTSRYNFLPPMLTNRQEYVCFCDCCGICSGWHFSQKDATDEFDRIVREQIEYTQELQEDAP